MQLLDILGNATPAQNLDLKDSIGFTGYIDFLTIHDVPHPLMSTIDSSGRPVVVMHIKDNIDGRFYLQAFHQRYPSNPNLWVGAGSNELFCTSGGMKPTQCAFLKHMAQGGQEVAPAGDIRFNRGKDLSNHTFRLATQDEVDEMRGSNEPKRPSAIGVPQISASAQADHLRQGIHVTKFGRGVYVSEVSTTS